jgi:hypothetical protein
MAKIKIGQTEFDMLFNINALNEIIKKYGGMTQMEKSLLQAKSETESIGAYIWIITTLINQAALAHNMDVEMGILVGENSATITEQYVMAKLRPKDLFSQRNAVFQTISEDSSFETDDEPEEKDEVLAEIEAEKNV